MSVSVMVDSRCASVIDSGTVYGPPPTRMVGPGGEMTTCAAPMPGDEVGTAAPVGVDVTGAGSVWDGGGVAAVVGAVAAGVG